MTDLTTKIQVYKNYHFVDQKYFFASIQVDNDGNIVETIFIPGQEADLLRKALAEIEATDSLPIDQEKLEETDGELRLILYKTKIHRGDSGYAWAVHDYLIRQCGFWCEMLRE